MSYYVAMIKQHIQSRRNDCAIIFVIPIVLLCAARCPLLQQGGYDPRSPPFQCNCAPEGPAAGAKRPHVAEGCEGERSETIVPETTD